MQQCPDIVLNPRSIKLIIESGTFDQVISEHNGTSTVPLEDVGKESTSNGTLAKIKQITKKPKKKKQAQD